MVTDRVGIALVGSGFMATTYAETLAHYTTGARLVAVAVGRRAPGLAERYGVAYEPSLESLVARRDVDAVIVTTPEMAHLEQTRVIADAGKHLLVEKPMAVNIAQCDEMIAACRKAGVKLMMVQSQRFRGVHRRAKRLLDEGRIGTVWQIRMTSMQAEQWSVPVVRDRPFYADPNGGGLFMGQCTHNFDMMRWIAGSEARRVYAQVRSYGQHGLKDLSVMAQVEFANGVIGQLWVCMETPGTRFPRSQFHTQVIGAKGLMDFDGYESLDVATDGRWERVWEQPPFDPLNPNDPIRLESFTAQNQAFIDCILNDTEPPVTGQDGRAAVELCQAALQSAHIGRPVDLPL